MEADLAARRESPSSEDLADLAKSLHPSTYQGREAALVYPLVKLITRMHGLSLSPRKNGDLRRAPSSGRRRAAGQWGGLA